MILYCETSVLLKLFVDEEESDCMIKAHDSAQTIAICCITWAEAMPTPGAGAGADDNDTGVAALL